MRVHIPHTRYGFFYALLKKKSFVCLVFWQSLLIGTLAPSLNFPDYGVSHDLNLPCSPSPHQNVNRPLSHTRYSFFNTYKDY